ncbi:hypothetical protein HZC32_01635 [Candidatus Woesearchaeota archaeon]|nr:hypothetical protein [Candidatus Woesearchaeota archaeon]
MTKKCIICNHEAMYRVKDSPDFYCKECAEENFGDLNLLMRVEEEAQKLKEVVKQRMRGNLDKEDSEQETEETKHQNKKRKPEDDV